MRMWCTGVLASAALLLLPSVVLAQASITGSVKDTSGALLPGVTVEASSPALIEKVRIGRHRRQRPVPDRGSSAGHATSSPSSCRGSAPSNGRTSS